MMRNLILFLVLALYSCGSGVASSGRCDAEKAQSLVGIDALEAVKSINSQPKHVQDNAYYVGSKEVIGSDVSQNALLIEIDVDEVHQPTDLIGRKVTRVYCR